MVLRILAWIAVVLGVVITGESVLVAHQPNYAWILVLVLGLAYFAKNGFMRKSPSAKAQR